MLPGGLQWLQWFTIVSSLLTHLLLLMPHLSQSLLNKRKETKNFIVFIVTIDIFLHILLMATIMTLTSKKNFWPCERDEHKPVSKQF